MDENRENQEVEVREDSFQKDPPNVPLNTIDQPPFIQKKKGIPSYMIAIIVGAILLGILLLAISTIQVPEKKSGSEKGEETSVVETPVYEPKYLYVDEIAVSEYTADDTVAAEYSGSIAEESEIDEFTFTAETSGRYGLFFHDLKNGMQLSVKIIDGLGNTTGSTYAQGPEYTFTTELDAGTQYTIEIKGYGLWNITPGDYYFTVYQPKNAVDISEYTLVHDSAVFVDQINSYTFTAKEKGTYVFSFYDMVNNMTITCEVIDKLGYEVSKETYLTNESSMKVSLDAGETYTVNVLINDRTGFYTMGIGQKKPVVDISGYDIVMDKMQYEKQVINYTFIPAESGYYQFTASDMKNGMKLSAKIIDEGEYELDQNSDMSSGQYIRAQLTHGNTYTLVIHQNQDLGEYGMQIEFQN